MGKGNRPAVTFYLIVALCQVLLACGGGGGGGGGGSSPAQPSSAPPPAPPPPSNGPPVVADSGFQVEENARTIGTLAASDPDNDPLNFRLANPSVLFAISAGGEITVRPGQNLDHATQAQHQFNVIVEDGQGNSDSALITVTVRDPGSPHGLQVRPADLTHNFPASAPNLTGVSLEKVHEGLSNPLGYHAVPNSSIRLVLEQGGRIRWFHKNSLTAGGTFMQVPDTLSGSGEGGLLGLAFDPNFSSNGYFYLSYTEQRSTSNNCIIEFPIKYPACSVIARFRLSGSPGNFVLTQGDPASKTLVLEQRQPYWNHNGGQIAFGPDGLLYISLGDGGGDGGSADGGVSQDRTNLLGSVLRIDVNALPYSIPADNPYVGNANSWREEIWAYGLRNPWRFSFDRTNGQLWLADVGQGSIEEVNQLVAGGNYGWKYFEGNDRFGGGTPPAGLSFPALTYPHSEGYSVTGGFVYRGSRLSSWQGWYFFGDLSGPVWATDSSNPGNRTLIGLHSGFISSFGEDEEGELYLVSHSNGEIYKLVPTAVGSSTIPTQISDTGLFTNLASLSAATGLIPYAVNTPLWSDGTIKTRWFYVPGADQIGFDENNPWSLPAGSIVVKHFAMPMTDGNLATLRHLETRVLVHHTQGWRGYTYRWNTGQTNATLVETVETEQLVIQQAGGGTRQQNYTYPGQTDCLVCHNPAAGPMLGLSTPQMNRDFDYGAVTDNQLSTLDHIALFSISLADPATYNSFPDPYDNSANLDNRARAYLDVNCAVCHRPGGPTPSNLDLRFSTGLNATNALETDPQYGQLGIGGAKIIAQGSKEQSVLWERMRRTDYTRMPPDYSHRVDQGAIDLVGSWIDSL